MISTTTVTMAQAIMHVGDGIYRIATTMEVTLAVAVILIFITIAIRAIKSI